MSALVIASIVCVCVFGCGILGLFIRVSLPEHHLNEETMGMVKLGVGLMATLAALVLGLLVASAKVSLDRLNDEFKNTAATVVMLDRILADYGPETKEDRELLRSTYASAVEQYFAGGLVETANVGVPERLARVEQFQHKIRELAPQNDMQRSLQSEALALSRDLMHTRWMLLQPDQSAIPTPFLVVLVFWVAILFSGFGLVGDNNRTVILTLLVCALSVSSAIFLIEDIAHPLEGFMRISQTPARNALSSIGH
jgi:ABC-type amino acid transport system permease subunit